MQKINHCFIEFDLEFGCVNNKLMTVALSSDENITAIQPGLIDGKYLAKSRLYIDLPAVVKLRFSGKDHTTDVIFDQDGKITQDMYVKILGVNLDGFNLNEKFIHQGLTINTTDGQTWTTSYIGFNGEILLDLSEPNVFLQYHSILNR